MKFLPAILLPAFTKTLIITTATLLLLLVCLLIQQQNNNRDFVSAAKSASTKNTLFPTYHVRPATNWVNDPNFLMRDPRTRIVHLFCQYNEYPNSTQWGNMSVAHMISHDYVNWQRLPVALRPGPEAYDKGGVFSGSTTFIPDPSGSGQLVPVVVYTCVDSDGTERQCVATPTNAISVDPYMEKWTKSPANPIINAPPAGGIGMNFRDPTTGWSQKFATNNPPSSSSSSSTSSQSNNKKNIFNSLHHHDETASSDFVYVAFAAEIGINATIVTYRFKPDMTAATFNGVFYQPTKTYENMIECPDVFLSDVQPNPPLANAKMVILKNSNMAFRQDFYRIGEYDETTIQFGETNPVKNFLDFGTFYASKTFWDPVDRMRVLFGWIDEDGYDGGAPNAPIATNWAGAQSLPRKVTYNATYQKLQTPPLAALSQLRSLVVPTTIPGNQLLAPGQAYTVTNAGDASVGLAHEIYFSMSVPDVKAFVSTETEDYDVSMRILGSASGAFFTGIGINIPSGESTAQVNNTDFPGYDILDLPIPPARESESEQEQIDRCRLLCELNPACLAFTYVRKNNNGIVPPYDYSPRCSMKGRDFVPAVPRPFSPCCVSARVRKPRLYIDRTHSNTLGAKDKIVARATTLVVNTTKASEVLITMRIFVDHSFVEVYNAEGLDVASTRVYLEDADQNGIQIVFAGPSNTPAQDRPRMNNNVLVYQMSSIWN